MLNLIPQLRRKHGDHAFDISCPDLLGLPLVLMINITHSGVWIVWNESFRQSDRPWATPPCILHYQSWTCALGFMLSSYETARHQISAKLTIFAKAELKNSITDLSWLTMSF